MITVETLCKDLKILRDTSPLVHNITNYVVMNTTANALLALGASPVMAHAMDEVEDMVAIAGALVLNIGTLSGAWVDAMLRAGKAAQKKGIPIVLDPVGAGATAYRTETCLRLIDVCKPTIIRGNASEIMALVQQGVQTKGVDSTAASSSAVESARQLARESGAVVTISGAVDYSTDGEQLIEGRNGSDLMPKVTGMGCTATAVVGAFAAINSSPLMAAAHGMAVMGITGERAARKSQGPGSLQMHFIDGLYALSDADIRDQLDVQE